MNLLKIIILMMELGGYAFVLKRFVSIPFPIAPPIIASSIILLLYGFGFLISLKPVSLTLHLVGVIAFLISLKNSAPPKLSHVGLTLILIIIVFQFWYLNYSSEFSSWDEFSHWGTMIRATYEANSFIFSPNPLYFQDYPPGTALFTYHLLTLLGYSESNAFFAHSLLLLCFAAPIIGTAINKQIYLGVAAFVLVYYWVMFLGSGWSSVLIDQIVSLIFAGSIVSYFALQAQNRALTVIPLLLSALVLSKHVGSSLAIMAAGICVIDRVILYRTNQHNSRRENLDSFFSYSHILWIAALFFLPYLVHLSWKCYVIRYGLNQGWGTMSILDFITKSFSCCTTLREIDVAGKFFSKYLALSESYKQPASLPYFFGNAISHVSLFKLIFNSPMYVLGKLALIFSLSGIVLSSMFASGQRRLRFIILNLELTLGLFLYSMSLLLTYLYGFSDYEAAILTSFERYHNIFFLAWAVILVYIFIELLDDRALTKSKFILVSCLVLISFWMAKSLSLDSKIYKLQEIKSFSEPRQTIKNFLNSVASDIPKDSRVYISWYGSNGWEFWMMKHELLPHMTNLDCFSLGSKVNAKDLWTCPFRASMLKKYDYFLIGSGLHTLNEHHPGVFMNVPPKTDRGLFKINNNKTGLHLIYTPERK